MDSTLVLSFEETMEVKVQVQEEDPTKVQEDAKEKNAIILDLEEKEVGLNSTLDVVLPVISKLTRMLSIIPISELR